jgi:hypothetical protein
MKVVFKVGGSSSSTVLFQQLQVVATSTTTPAKDYLKNRLGEHVGAGQVVHAPSFSAQRHNNQSREFSDNVALEVPSGGYVSSNSRSGRQESLVKQHVVLLEAAIRNCGGQAAGGISVPLLATLLFLWDY